MTARGYCCCYLEHCSETNYIAIKGVIIRAKYENVFGLVDYQGDVQDTSAIFKLALSIN